ncbi:GMC family oxidoreductase [Methylobacterium sp. Leaf117]|uniref:GMC oxidoreductase n=1 Tax=Methylobacterium sp. Leaf117 TaxID=1736260 RepID=UPI0006FD6B11|nr:GMC family oxidoreductase [Methylobacterium sp. Leaf117]KQP80265.1 dehydrogenase [Methylobacterium sp. Leaf117]
MPADHYDVIVIGSGPGGGSLTSRLASTGKRILLLERGDYLPRSQENWSAKAVFVEGKYQAKETWYGGDGHAFHPGLHYYVGGNSKVYGAALFRMRERDFGEVRHVDGVSPAWPVSYAEFEPYYAEAERLFAVHGNRGEDPNEPWSSGPYDYPAVSHAPRIQKLSDDWRKAGLRPFHLPLGIKLDERNGRPTPTSICIRCDAFDGFPCLLNGKADAQVMTVDPTLDRHDNVTLLVNAYVSRLETDPVGRTVTGVCVTREGQEERYSADVVVVACGALCSALLLLRSANAVHPNGLANGSDQVGRNYIRHNMSVLMGLSKEVNETIFQKTLAVSDFYFGSQEWEFPMGLIQMCAKTHPDQIRGEEFPAWTEFLPNAPFDMMARHSVDFWLQSEDLPHPDNRITIGRDGRVTLNVAQNNREAHERLRLKLEELLEPGGLYSYIFERSLYLGKDIPLSGTAHQAGTLRFGTDPKASVLDPNCKAHELDNLYATDASFFPSIGAVNPTLTIIANALRVADHIERRLT